MTASQRHAVAVVDAYRWHVHMVSVTAGHHAQQAWRRSLGDRTRWFELTAGISLAARRQAAAATSAMHGLILGAPPQVELDPIASAADPAWSNPIDRFDKDRTGGLAAELALTAGLARAFAAAQTDVTSAARQAAQVIDAGEPRIVGYWRTLSPRACVWCAEVAGQQYNSAATASSPNHGGHCHCLVVPVTIDVDPGRQINAGLAAKAAASNSAYVTDTGEEADRPDS